MFRFFVLSDFKLKIFAGKTKTKEKWAFVCVCACVFSVIFRLMIH